MKNYRLELCYEGSRYRGWQKQGNTDNTIQAKLEALLSRLLDQEIELSASGRTDAGVHARRQVCSFRAETGKSCAQLLGQLRRELPEDIGAISLEEAPPRFHARLSCRGKTYLYRLWNSDEPCVFERRTVTVWPEALDEEAMRRAAALLVGRHNFGSFCGNPRMKKSTVRELRSIELVREGEELRLFFEGDGFLMNMVRILTGTLLEVGAHRREPEEMPAILSARERSAAGFTAPARGLTLWDVRYE
ncbi:MAG: tRNA pseudouridine(38-40) synthase TruA [Oscillospiraceae bacterium]|nr:tRNA pseudouridine(38-40) synthase TruA [Oscillospiraceae bacterium]